MRKILSVVLSFGLLFQQSGLVYAVGELNLANYLSQARSAIAQPDQFRPAQLRYISYDIKSNDFKLLLDKGGAKLNELSNSLNSSTPKLNNTTQELFNYFLIGLSLLNDTFWVNLRPDAPENIIDPLLEKTDIGKIFLEADLQLKKDTASLTSPQNLEGKAYWDKLYKKAGELFGTENITIPTITRPWIVPNEVIVRETEDSAYIYKATLKVMLESDYLIGRGGSRTAPTPDQYAFSDPRLKELNEYSSQIIRETIIPKLTKEINSSKRYAQLRQVYYSLVLARWFKQKYQGLPVGNGLKPFPTLDSGDLTNLTSQEPCDKQAYFQAYQKSFKDGEYNLKENVATPFGQSIRSYISGGIVASPIILGGTRKEGENPEVTKTLIGQHAAIVGSPLTVQDAKNQMQDVVDNWEIELKKLFGEDEAKKSYLNSSYYRHTMPFQTYPLIIYTPEELFKNISKVSKAVDGILTGVNIITVFKEINKSIYQDGFINPKVNITDFISLSDKAIHSLNTLIDKLTQEWLTELRKDYDNRGLINSEEDKVVRDYIDRGDLGNALYKLRLIAQRAKIDGEIGWGDIYNLRRADEIRKLANALDDINKEIENNASAEYKLEDIDIAVKTLKEVGKYIERFLMERILDPSLYAGRAFSLVGIKGFLSINDLVSASRNIAKMYNMERRNKDRVDFSVIDKERDKWDILRIKAMGKMSIVIIEIEHKINTEFEELTKKKSSLGRQKRIDRAKQEIRFELKRKHFVKVCDIMIWLYKQNNDEAKIKKWSLFKGEIGPISIKLPSIPSYPVAKSGSPLTATDEEVKYVEDTRAKLAGFYKWDSKKSAEAELDDLIEAAEKAGESGIKPNAMELSSEVEEWYAIAERLNKIKSGWSVYAGSPLTQTINDLYAKLVPYENDAIVFGRPMKSKEIDNSMEELLDLALSSSDFFLDANTNEFRKLKIIFQLAAKYDDSKYKGISSYASHLMSNIGSYQSNKNTEEFILNVFRGYVDLLISNSTQETLKLRESASIAGVSMTYYDLNALKEEFPDDNELTVISNHYEKIKNGNPFTSFKLRYELGQGEKSLADLEDILKGFFPGSKDIIRFDELPPADVIETISDNLLRYILLIPDHSLSDISERSNNIKRLFALASSKRYKKHSLYSEILNFMSEESSLTESELQYAVKKGIANYIDQFILRFKSSNYKSVLERIHLKYGYSEERLILRNVPGLNESDITVKEYNLKILIEMASLAQKIAPADRAANKMALEVFQFLKECTSSSSLTVAIVSEVKRGGIDLTDRMLKINLERVGSFALSSLALPEIANVEALDLDEEYERIQAMVSSNIRPSDTRILEFAAACYYRREFDQRLAQVSSCIKSAHLADEILGRDSSEALRLATMLPDALYGG